MSDLDVYDDYDEDEYDNERNCQTCCGEGWEWCEDWNSSEGCWVAGCDGRAHTCPNCRGSGLAKDQWVLVTRERLFDLAIAAFLALAVVLLLRAGCAGGGEPTTVRSTATATEHAFTATSVAYDAGAYEVPTTSSTRVPVTARASRKAARPRNPDGTGAAAVNDRLDQIAWCESRQRADAVSSSGKFRGAWQFDRRTWDANAPEHMRGQDPASFSYDEQKAVAAALYDRRGPSPWPTCGR